MAFKKIKLSAHDCCPNCGGKKGVSFSQQTIIKCRSAWGASDKNFLQGIDVPINRENKTVVCFECEKRFELIQKENKSG